MLSDKNNFLPVLYHDLSFVLFISLSTLQSNSITDCEGQQSAFHHHRLLLESRISHPFTQKHKTRQSPRIQQFTTYTGRRTLTIIYYYYYFAVSFWLNYIYFSHNSLDYSRAGWIFYQLINSWADIDMNLVDCTALGIIIPIYCTWQQNLSAVIISSRLVPLSSLTGRVGQRRTGLQFTRRTVSQPRSLQFFFILNWNRI